MIWRTVVTMGLLVGMTACGGAPEPGAVEADSDGPREYDASNDCLRVATLAQAGSCPPGWVESYDYCDDDEDECTEIEVDYGGCGGSETYACRPASCMDAPEECEGSSERVNDCDVDNATSCETHFGCEGPLHCACVARCIEGRFGWISETPCEEGEECWEATACGEPATGLWCRPG